MVSVGLNKGHWTWRCCPRKMRVEDKILNGESFDVEVWEITFLPLGKYRLTTSCLDGCVDVRELARLFVYDPRACEKFVKKIIDTGMVLSNVFIHRIFWFQTYDFRTYERTYGKTF